MVPANKSQLARRLRRLSSDVLQFGSGYWQQFVMIGINYRSDHSFDDKHSFHFHGAPVFAQLIRLWLLSFTHLRYYFLQTIIFVT